MRPAGRVAVSWEKISVSSPRRQSSTDTVMAVGMRVLTSCTRSRCGCRGQCGQVEEDGAAVEYEHEFGRAFGGVGERVREISGRMGTVAGVQRGATVDGDVLEAAGQDEEALAGTAAMRGEGRRL